MSIPISLEKAVEAMWADGAPDPKVLKLLKKVLGNILSSPDEAKFRSLNSQKMIPRLAAQGLAPLYVVRHAGFVPGTTHYVLKAGGDVSAVQTALAAVVSKELGVPVDPSSLLVGPGGGDGGSASAIGALSGKKAKGPEVSADEAAEELKRIEEAEIEFNERKAARLLLQREKEAAEAVIAAAKAAEEATHAPVPMDTEAEEAAEKKAKKAEAGKAEMEAMAAMADGDLDEGMQAIIKNMQSRAGKGAGGGGGVGAASTRIGLVDTGGKKMSEMTSEEKMQWLEDSKKENAKRKQQQMMAREKDREKSRVTTAKAAMELKERQEAFHIQAAVSEKKREEKERRIARKRIKEKIANAKRERES